MSEKNDELELDVDFGAFEKINDAGKKVAGFVDKHGAKVVAGVTLAGMALGAVEPVVGEPMGPGPSVPSSGPGQAQQQTPGPGSAPNGGSGQLRRGSFNHSALRNVHATFAVPILRVNVPENITPEQMRQIITESVKNNISAPFESTAPTSPDGDFIGMNELKGAEMQSEPFDGWAIFRLPCGSYIQAAVADWAQANGPTTERDPEPKTEPKLER